MTEEQTIEILSAIREIPKITAKLDTLYQALMGDMQVRVKLLEAQQESRTWHIRALWGAMVIAAGKLAVDMFTRRSAGAP